MPSPVPIPGDTSRDHVFLERIRVADLASTGAVTVVQHYDQGADVRIGQQEVTKGGWCLGMVVDWLNHKKNQQAVFGAYWDTFMAADKAAKIAFPMKAQKFAASAGLAGIQSTTINLMKSRKFANTVVSGKEEHAWSAGGILLLVKQAPYSILGLHGPGGAHAIAFACNWTWEEFYVMDPNFGEVMIQSKIMLGRWLTAFIARTGYADSYPKFSVMGFE